MVYNMSGLFPYFDCGFNRKRCYN